jgi:hypothetical protein
MAEHLGIGGALTKHQEALVASYRDQLLYGRTPDARLHAAAGLGRLDRLLAVRV